MEAARTRRCRAAHHAAREQRTELAALRRVRAGQAGKIKVALGSFTSRQTLCTAEVCRGGPGGGKSSSPGAACSTVAMALRGSSFPRPPPQGARYTHMPIYLGGPASVNPSAPSKAYPSVLQPLHGPVNLSPLPGFVHRVSAPGIQAHDKHLVCPPQEHPASRGQDDLPLAHVLAPPNDSSRSPGMLHSPQDIRHHTPASLLRCPLASLNFDSMRPQVKRPR